MSRCYDQLRFALTLGLVALLMAGGAMNAQVDQVPLGWYANVAVPGEYIVRGDIARRPAGSGFMTGTIVSATREPTQWALMQQSIRADAYRGQRVRVTGYLKTDIGGGESLAGLFVRVDTDHDPEASNFMLGHQIVTTTNWELCSVVVDVPRNAVGITFGFQLTGAGQAWLDDVTFEAVGHEVALDFAAAQVVGQNGNGAQRHSFGERYRNAPLHPINLNFEQVRIVAER